MGFWLTLVLVSAVMMTGHRSFVSPAALPQLPQLPQLDTGGVIGQHHAPGSHAMDSAFPEDAEVQELESLKQPANEGQSVHIVNTQTSSVHNEDGNQNERHDVHEYVDENGKLVARVHQHSETSSSPGEKPHGHQTTEVEVPDMGIHKTMEQETPTEGQKEVGKAFHGAARLMQSASEAVPPPAPALPAQITENGHRRAFSNKARNSDLDQEENNNMDHYSAYSGVQYSPLDMAEYIFWTGDEKGVTLAIEEFLQEGLMNREEAIAFLQEIKNNIEYLQVHAQQRSKSIAEEQMQQNKQFRDLALKNDNNYQYDMDEQRSAWPIASSMGKFNHQNMLKAIASASYERNNDLSAAVNQPQLPISLPDFRQNLYKKSLQESNNYKLYAQNNNLYQEPTDLYERESTPTISEEDYEELLEKLRVADFLYTEYSLEEVIYQLAKVMFSQSLARGSTEAQMALQKFTTFLETEAEQGRISRALEKKILDVLIESLTDTLTEHPELVSAARVGLGSTSSLPSGNKILHQLLELGPNESEAAKPSIISAYKDEMAKVKSSKNKAHWEKTREHSVGENQSGPLLMPSVKRFKMSV